MPPVVFLVWGLVFLLGACGAAQNESKVFEDTGTGGATNTGTTGSQNLKDVTLTLVAGQPAVVTPPNIPPQNAQLRTIKFSANLSWKPAVGKSFAYANVNWGLRFTRPGQADPLQTTQQLFRVRDTDKKLKVITDSFVQDRGNKIIAFEETGVVEFQLDLAEGDWNLIYALISPPAAGARQQIAVQLFYALNDNATSLNPENYATIPPIFMQNDIGTLVNPAKVAVVGSSSGEITLEFSGPDDLGAVLPANGFSSVEGKSILSGYRLMYWKEGDCSDANWVFESNPIFRTNPNMSDPSFNCSYADYSELSQGTNTCPLGCSQAGSDFYWGKGDSKLNNEDVAVPLSSGSCYQVATVPPGRKTFSLTGLENNAKYFVIAWPLDSAGTLGQSRSSCVQGVPLKIPFAAAQDGPESISDCFIATAASGSSSSLTVHYWRVIRDRWLDRLGVSKFYYKYAPSLAQKLQAHPSLKPAVNAVLLYSGQFLVAIDRALLTLNSFIVDVYAQLSSWVAQVLGSQWQSEAKASDAGQDAPRSKLLRSYSEIEKETQAEEPSKSLKPGVGAAAEKSSTAAATEEKPTKSLKQTIEPTAGAGTDGPVQNDAEQPRSKALPPPSAEAMSHTEKEPSRFPEGSAFSAVRFSGGLFIPQDTSLWKAYYPEGNPFFLSLNQTFRLFDAFGEFGLGIQASLQNHSGRVPATLPDGSSVNEAVAGRRISYYQTGVYIASDYRLRYLPVPPVAPRFLFNLGVERLRETAETTRTKEDVDTGKGKVGVTLWKPMVQAGLSLELSFGALFGKGFQGKILGYGARDFLLGFTGLFSFDLSGDKFSQTGLLAGGSLVLLIE